MVRSNWVCQLSINGTSILEINSTNVELFFTKNIQNLVCDAKQEES